MAANAFRIVTTWTVEGTIAEAAAILQDSASLPRWWSEVYLGTEIVAPGGENGIGRKVAVHSKGWLPYHLHWTATLEDNRSPETWTVSATGDLDGRGVWRLTQKGPLARIEYDWEVRAERPILRLLSPLLKPLFAWNHRWAMAKGEAGLKRELARRRG